MYKYNIYDSGVGYKVYVNLISSSAGQYASRHPQVINLMKEALASTKLKDAVIVVEKDMGRVIGNTDIVKTTDKDTIYYAQPVKQTVFTRIARNRYPAPSRKLTMHLKQDKAGNYEIINTWIGPSSPPFPGHVDEKANSKTYWQNHALVQDAQKLQSQTITKTCPY
jgi:hypothetical protein